MQERYTPPIPSPMSGGDDVRLVHGLCRTGPPADGDFLPARARPGEFFATVCQRAAASERTPWRMLQESASLVDVVALAEHARGKIDQFVTQLAFKRPCRRKQYVASAACLFVDLDLYTVADMPALGAGHSATERALAVVGWMDARGLPAPSYIIASGRGLHLKWLHERLPKRALCRWQQVIKHLVRALVRLGADPRATDVSRVLRIVGSMHPESGESVREVWRQSGALGGVREYQFDELARTVLPRSREDACRKKKTPRRRQRARGATPCAHALKNLWEPRLHDLSRLAEMRGWDVSGVPDGQRVTFMLLQVVALSYVHVGDLFERLLDESVERYVPHWSEHKLRSSLSNVFARAGTPRQLRFRTDTIIEMLAISPAEQRRLSVLRCQGRAERRRETQRTRRRRAGVQDMGTLEKRRRELGRDSADAQRWDHLERGLLRTGDTSIDCSSLLGARPECLNGEARTGGKAGGV